LRKFKPLEPAFTLENAFSPDGQTGLTTANNTVVLWDLTVPTADELLAWIAQNRYVRALSCEERELYQIQPLCQSP
jgi:hypothetical protein